MSITNYLLLERRGQVRGFSEKNWSIAIGHADEADGNRFIFFSGVVACATPLFLRPLITDEFSLGWWISIEPFRGLSRDYRSMKVRPDHRLTDSVAHAVGLA
jgi:hypothetical protein